MNFRSPSADSLAGSGSHPRRGSHLARRLAREQRGVALVEFALILPIFVLLVVGVISFGIALNYWIDETHLANEAARYAAVNKNPGPGSTLQTSVKQQADSNELRNGGTTNVPDAAQLCISYPDGTAVGNRVQATMSVTYNWIPFLGDRIGVASSTITGKSVMRLEAVPTNVPAGCS